MSGAPLLDPTMTRHIIQHHLNSLHLLARLVRLGMRPRTALAVARRWERLTHPWLYRP